MFTCPCSASFVRNSYCGAGLDSRRRSIFSYRFWLGQSGKTIQSLKQLAADGLRGLYLIALKTLGSFWQSIYLIGIAVLPEIILLVLIQTFREHIQTLGWLPAFPIPYRYTIGWPICPCPSLAL